MQSKWKIFLKLNILRFQKISRVMLKITAFHIVSLKQFYGMENRAREIGCAGAKQTTIVLCSMLSIPQK
jgi:hypothetical protein